MSKLGELATALYDAKKAEDDANAKRIAIEEEIAALVETGDNGSKTVDAENGLKLTVKRAMTYKADVQAIREIGDAALPAGFALPLAFVEEKPATWEFDEKAYEVLREKSPLAFAKIAKFVTAKPRKVSVALKLA